MKDYKYEMLIQMFNLIESINQEDQNKSASYLEYIYKQYAINEIKNKKEMYL